MCHPTILRAAAGVGSTGAVSVGVAPFVVVVGFATSSFLSAGLSFFLKSPIDRFMSAPRFRKYGDESRRSLEQENCAEDSKC